MINKKEIKPLAEIFVNSLFKKAFGNEKSNYGTFGRFYHDSIFSH